MSKSTTRAEGNNSPVSFQQRIMNELIPDVLTARNKHIKPEMQKFLYSIPNSHNAYLIELNINKLLAKGVSKEEIERRCRESTKADWITSPSYCLALMILVLYNVE